ncbi:hypothetical protein NMY22_g8846 [Coprinellus aureogranulatus]|nr:hypothetical protein NMY22_g8846 [Coprinellus aureogranulatus]
MCLPSDTSDSPCRYSLPSGTSKLLFHVGLYPTPADSPVLPLSLKKSGSWQMSARFCTLTSSYELRVDGRTYLPHHLGAPYDCVLPIGCTNGGWLTLQDYPLSVGNGDTSLRVPLCNLHSCSRTEHLLAFSRRMTDLSDDQVEMLPSIFPAVVDMASLRLWNTWVRSLLSVRYLSYSAIPDCRRWASGEPSTHQQWIFLFYSSIYSALESTQAPTRTTRQALLVLFRSSSDADMQG